MNTSEYIRQIVWPFYYISLSSNIKLCIQLSLAHRTKFTFLVTEKILYIRRTVYYTQEVKEENAEKKIKCDEEEKKIINFLFVKVEGEINIVTLNLF